MTASMKPRTRISRRAYFSAAQAYAHPGWSEEQNRAAYGSLYSPHGTGHNFTLEIHVEGTPHPDSGMVVNFKTLDVLLNEVTNKLDHRHLNHDVPAFQDLVPTAENIARYCFHELDNPISALGAQLVRVRLFEGDDTWVDFERV